MKVQIFYKRTYFAFDLYINSIRDIFKNDSYFLNHNYELSTIKDLNIFSSEENIDFLILFLNDIESIFNINTKNTKIIFIHADYLLNHSKSDQDLMHKYINEINPNNSYIWEYNQLNIQLYNNKFSNKKYTFIPLLYNNYLEQIYEPYKLKIPFHKKKVDVLFPGSECERRKLLLDKISKKYNLVSINFISNVEEYIKHIENSKIVINIYSSETNKPFDYYRFALLYSNKVFLITESPQNIDFEIEKNLIELKDTMICAKYDDIIHEIEKYLNKTEEEINQITEKSYNSFKRFPMNQYIIDFFEKFSSSRV